MKQVVYLKAPIMLFALALMVTGASADILSTENGSLVSANANITPPSAAFSANVTSGNAPLTVAFTDASTGTAPLTYQWDFINDGTTDATTQNATYTYSSEGNYTVNLTVTNDAGSNSSVKTDYIVVTSAPVAPVAAFSANKTSGVAPLAVAFTDASTGTAPLTYQWDLDGDGVIDSTLPAPVVVYESAGNYTVNLTVTNDAGSNSSVKTDYIVVTSAPVAPVAAFSANKTSGEAPLTVAFTDASTGTAPLTYQWDFINDGTTDATTRNATYTYSSAGIYTVNLTVTNDAGNDSEVKTNYIFVTNVTPRISAQFAASPLSGYVPLPVRFTDQSYGTITWYEWDFNNDGIIDSRMKNPLYFYTSTGEYTVKLIVRGPDGVDQEIKDQYINVSARPLRPITLFSADKLSGKAPLTVNFTDKTFNDPDSHYWQFGDGTSSSTKNPSHNYLLPGYYRVSLTTTNEAGSSSMALYIFVMNE